MKLKNFNQGKKSEPAASLWRGRREKGAKGADRQKYIIYYFHNQYSIAA